jgi:hypothetical protein
LARPNPAAAHTSRAAVRDLVLDLLDWEAVELMAGGQDPLPKLDETTLVELVLTMLFGLGSATGLHRRRDGREHQSVL